MAPHDLLLPPDLHWSCIGCGRSCEDWSEVEVEPAEAERLRRLPLFSARLPSAGRGEAPCVAGRRRPGQLRMRMTADGDGDGAEDRSRCVLLDEDDACAVHAVHGPEAKPASCRVFPWTFIETPDGVHAGLSFACTAVLHDLGAAAAVQGDEARDMLALSMHRERRGRGIRLGPGRALEWNDYLAVEGALEGARAAASDVAAGLLAQARWLRREAGLTPLDERPAPELRRFTLAWLTGCAGAPPSFHPPRGLTGLEAPDPEVLLRRWVRHRIWRKDLLRGGEVLFAHGLLIAEVALARAWARIQPGGMAEAIAQVERGLALHSDLVKRIDALPTLPRSGTGYVRAG